MPRLPVVTAKQLIHTITKTGFVHIRSRGSHQIFEHTDGRYVVVPVHSRDIPKGTLHAMLKDIEISTEEFRKLLKG